MADDEFDTSESISIAGEQPVDDADIGYAADETTAADNPQLSDAPDSPVSEAVASPAQAAFNLREFAASQGLNGLKDAPDDAAAAQQLLGYVQQLQRAQQQQQYQVHQYHQQLQEARQQAQRVQHAAPVEAPKPAWQAPEYDPAWLELVERDANGNLVARPGAQPDLPQKVMAYAQWQKQQEQAFYKNPGEFILPQIQDHVRQIIQSELEGGLQQRQTQAFVQNTVAQNADWIYAKDPTGRAAVDMTTGQPQFTAEGQRYFQYAQQAVQMGIGDPRAQDQYARSMLRADLQQLHYQTQTVQQSAAQTNANLKTATLQNGAARKPNRGGSVPRTSAPSASEQNPKLTLGQRMRRDMIAAGISFDGEDG